jgi:hypothetical protein
MFKPPKEDSRYSWTAHVWAKMQQYGLSESRIKRIVRFPERTEEGIAPSTIAVMQPSNPITLNGRRSWKQEIWVMYKVQKGEHRIKVITAWRYPGVSPKRDPVPAAIIREVQALL